MDTKRKLYIAAAVLIVLVVALGLLTACTSESLVEYEAPAVSTAPVFAMQCTSFLYIRFRFSLAEI